MARHGQASWPLKTPSWLCLLVCLSPAWLRAEAPALPPQSRSEGAQAPDPVQFVMAQAGPFTAARRDDPSEPVAMQQPGNPLMEMFFPSAGGERRLQLAPMRWRGNLGFEYRFVRGSEGAGHSEMMEFGNLDLATYIGQPWLVQVRANLGILALQQRRRDDDAFSGGADRSASLTGGTTVMVFPRSRFPFTASFESSDSRASGEITASDYTNRTMSLRQAYRSPLGDQVYAASLERSTLSSSSFGRDTVTALNGSAQFTRPLHVFDLSGGWSQNRRSAGDGGSDLGRLLGRHSWRPSELMNVETFASFSASDFGAGTGLGNESRFLQLNSFGTWRPEEESPYFLTGGLRFADATFGAGGTESTSRTLGGNVAGSYAITQHASLVASASLASLQGEGASDLVSTQSLAANYSPAPIPLGPVNYSWNTSASATNQTGGSDEIGSLHALGAQASHQVSSGKSFGTKASLTGSLSQGAGVLQDSLLGVTQTLTHSGSVSLRLTPTAGSDAYFGASVGDSRSQGGREDRFQLLNLQASGQLQLGVYSIFSANFTAQVIRQQLDAEEEPQTTVLRSGTLSYHHLRVFGVPRLRFIASATFNDMALESRLLGDAAALRDQYTQLFESRLQYDIGRLEFRLGTRLAKTDGRTDRQIFFRVNRQFGLF